MDDGQSRIGSGAPVAMSDASISLANSSGIKGKAPKVWEEEPGRSCLPASAVPGVTAKGS
jgi:hypothetical protein